ncbi:MAG TPA: hypothetical protein VF573_17495 [Paraburkholderia sp.]
MQRLTRIARHAAQVDHAVGIALGERLQPTVERRETIRSHVAFEAAEQVEFGAITEFVGRPLHRTMPQPVADVVAAHHEVTAAIIAPVHDEVNVWLIRVVVNDGHVVDLRVEIVFHAPHEVACELAHVDVAAVLRRNDETELVSAGHAALGEGVDGLAVEFAVAVEQLAALAVQIRAVACEIGQMIAHHVEGGLALHRHNARLDDDALRELPRCLHAGTTQVRRAR